MRKLVIRSAGGYEKLEIENCDDLIPKDEEVIVKTKAAGLNYADICIRWGIYSSAKEFVGWPITPGFEFSGVVSKVGRKTSTFKIGDHVWGGCLFNAQAEEVAALEKHIQKMPEGRSFEEMAGFPAVYLTAYHMLVQQVIFNPGDTLLIHSAAGGVGGALLQLARAFKLRAYGVVGSSHKIAIAKKMGAIDVFDKSSGDWFKWAKSVHPKGYNGVFDANGASTLKESYRCLKATGKLFTYGHHSLLPKESGKIFWPLLALKYLFRPKFDPIEMTTDNKGVIGLNLSYLFERDDLFLTATQHLSDLLEKNLIQPHNVKAFPIEEVEKAHKLIESGESTGKIVLTF